MNFSSFCVSAKERIKTGTRINYKLRKNGQIPAVIYGDIESTPITIDKKDSLIILKMLSSGYNLIKCKINNRQIFLIVKDIHNHPYKHETLHFDFQEVNINDCVTLRVLLKFSGENFSPGIKQGGFLIKNMLSVFVKTMVSKIPSYINVDLSKLNVNQSIFLSELNIPEGITLPLLCKKNSPNLSVASIVGSRSNESNITSK